MKKCLHILQDLSQPTSEALPPDGVLSVSLMKHQVGNSLFFCH